MQSTPFPAHSRPRRLRVSEYEELAGKGFFRGEHVELIHGIVVEMSPVGPSHANPLDLLVERLVPALVGRARVRVQQPFLAADDSEPEPDLAIVPLGQYAERHPDRAFSIIEVSETSLDYDRETKGPLYAAAGVAAYWVVDVNAREVEVFDLPSTTGYTRARRVAIDGLVPVPGFADVAVNVGELFPQ